MHLREEVSRHIDKEKETKQRDFASENSDEDEEIGSSMACEDYMNQLDEKRLHSHHRDLRPHQLLRLLLQIVRDLQLRDSSHIDDDLEIRVKKKKR